MVFYDFGNVHSELVEHIVCIALCGPRVEANALAAH